ncbi:MAG: AmmeMemoRadiSam system radical SAM enzyme [Actinobacteria bacterium]|nr:MAG: AmmeMemoRadiSam system radical SAM enzyme [Actinomycetota bacterium]
MWTVEGDRLRCGVCPHACLIAEGREGYCGVRRNEGGRMVPLTYGLISSIAADPVEKKPVFHYFPGTQVLSLGSVGCSMRCGHCQNWSISRAGPDDLGDAHTLTPERAVEMARSYRCPGVAFTYNEPVIWLEYVVDVARLCRERGLFTIMVTNGYITTEALDVLGPLIDVWRVDVKGLTAEQYRRLCKVTSPEPVFAAAERAARRWGMHVEVVTNVVPGVNDDEATLRGIAAWVRDALGVDTPWHVTGFVPYLEFADTPPTSAETLEHARLIGREEGLRFVYVGNVSVPGGEDTVCPNCGVVAVRRSGYMVRERATASGSCAACGTSLNLVE